MIERFTDREAWFIGRMGRPTASRFDQILTPAKMQLSQQRWSYLYKLLGERITGTPDEDRRLEDIKAIRQGMDREEEAVREYRWQTDLDVDDSLTVCISEGLGASCSPDGLVGDDGGLEVKCPNRGTHTGYLVNAELPLKYRLQVVGSLLVTGRSWWDFLSYHPDMQPLLVRTEAVDVRQEMDKLEAAVGKFVGELNDAELRYRERYE